MIFYRNRDRLRVALTLTACLFLPGCQNGEPVPLAQLQKRAQQLQPADPDLAALYQRSCRTCHNNSSTGAPLTGDAEAWAPRMSQGMELMVDHVIDGFKGMPPLGLCMDCNPEQFEALIEFMASSGSAG